jgi:hypothetical protein
MNTYSDNYESNFIGNVDLSLTMAAKYDRPIPPLKNDIRAR